MLCKKNDFPNNPVSMDKSEIRDFDKCRKSPIKIKTFYDSDHVIFYAEFGHIEFVCENYLYEALLSVSPNSLRSCKIGRLARRVLAHAQNKYAAGTLNKVSTCPTNLKDRSKIQVF
jgi:hypothetical protein